MAAAKAAVTTAQDSKAAADDALGQARGTDAEAAKAAVATNATGIYLEAAKD